MLSLSFAQLGSPPLSACSIFEWYSQTEITCKQTKDKGFATTRSDCQRVEGERVAGIRQHHSWKSKCWQLIRSGAETEKIHHFCSTPLNWWLNLNVWWRRHDRHRSSKAKGSWCTAWEAVMDRMFFLMTWEDHLPTKTLVNYNIL